MAAQQLDWARARVAEQGTQKGTAEYGEPWLLLGVLLCTNCFRIRLV